MASDQYPDPEEFSSTEFEFLELLSLLFSRFQNLTL